MRYVVTVEKEITIEFDENSEKFKELWEGYTSCIDSNADYQSFAENIASLVARYGVKEFIEGVGYLKHNGENQNFFTKGEYKEEEGIVNVDVETDLNSMVDFEVSHSYEKTE